MTQRSRLGRLLARLTGGAQLDRLAAIDEKIAKFGRAHREDLAGHRQQLEQVLDRLSTRAGADALRAVERRVEDLQGSFAGQDRTISNALERARLFDEQAVDDRRFARRMEALRRDDRPIIVGPWTGEVGFELLYWVPFVRWTVARYGIDPSRLTVVSRGGTAPWYGALAARYVDVLSMFSIEEFRQATEAAKKQRRVGAFDAHIVTRLRQRPGLHDAELLHPGMMYRLFQPFWREVATAARVEAYSDYARLTSPAPSELADLPGEYAAARFYFSDCFPDTPANRAFVTSTIVTISAQMPVVLLNAPFAVDDHRDFAAAGGRVISIAERMTPENNLGLQTAVIARARAFIGTYGGYSYLAPFHGVSALAFYSARTFKPHHLHLAQRVFDRLGDAAVLALEVGELRLVQLAVSAASVSAR
jgi:hypothetical protein